MSDKNEDKLTQALIKLNVKEYKFEGNEPTNEAEFLSRFKKVTGTDDSGGAVYTDDASKFGVTWTQVKTEMDKL